MIDEDRLRSVLASRKPWHSLPQPFYADADIFDFEQEAVFAKCWTMVGFEFLLDRPGAYVATRIGRTPIIVLRNRRDEIVGFHNSCRHRGAQICADGEGVRSLLLCPYHQWSYDLNGKLLQASRMAADFDRAEHGLLPIRVEVAAGCVYASLDLGAPDFGPLRAALEPALKPYNFAEAKVAHTVRLNENANWKLVMENGRECHHCAVSHPELKEAFPTSMADSMPDEAWAALKARLREFGVSSEDESGAWWMVGRLPFNPGVRSYSLDGQPLVSKPLTTLNGGDLGSLRWAIEPLNFCHVAADCAIMVNVEPISVSRTDVVATWMVHKDAVEGVDYDVARLIQVWNETNLQDRDLAENNQRGVVGLGYRPGPYSPEAESFVNRFVDLYCEYIAAALDRGGISKPLPGLAA